MPCCLRVKTELAYIPTGAYSEIRLGSGRYTFFQIFLLFHFPLVLLLIAQNINWWGGGIRTLCPLPPENAPGRNHYTIYILAAWAPRKNSSDGYSTYSWYSTKGQSRPGSPAFFLTLRDIVAGSTQALVAASGGTTAIQSYHTTGPLHLK